MSDAADPAFRRFLIINMVRIAGVAVLLTGVAVLGEVLEWPQPLGLALILLGGIGTFLLPTMLARRWSSKRQR